MKKASGLMSICSMRSDGRSCIQSVYSTRSILHSEVIAEVLTTQNGNNKEFETKIHTNADAADV